MAVLFSLIAAVFGAVLASFAAVIAERLHTGHSWLVARSRCNACGTQLSAADLVPVLSWTMSRGRCRYCASRVPALYTLVELTLASLFALSYLRLGPGVPLLLLLTALFLLTVIVLYDLRHTVVPSGPAALFVAVAAAYAIATANGAHMLGMTFLVAGAIALGFFILFAGSLGRAMGLGDAPVALGLALLAGAQAIPGLLFSFWIGAIIGIAILVGRRGGPTMGIEVPFVPFLAAGFLLAYFTGWNPLTFALF